MIVCHCFNVSCCQIKKCKDLEHVQNETNATRGCGGCLVAVKCLLKNKTENWFKESESDIETAVLAIDPDSIKT